MARFLAAYRYLLILLVIGCVFLTLGIVIMGIIRIFTGVVKLASAGDYSAKAAKIMALPDPMKVLGTKNYNYLPVIPIKLKLYGHPESSETY